MNFTKLDLYSKRIGFYYNNHDKIGSYFGLILTLIYILASLILFFYQMILSIQRKELKVYDTTIYSQDMPIINTDINLLYFSFGLEDPVTANRFIDEGIYVPEIVYIDKVKKDKNFETVYEKILEIEKCKVENFGKNYLHLFNKDELSNSYCLKNFNYNLTFAGGYKYKRLTYIRIKIYPCINSTKNNNSCKSQDLIDYYFSSGYFSIVLKDFGLNPSNYTSPVIPTFQDLYTTIDRRIHKNYILNFGLTEIHTDTGIIYENIKIEKYLQFRKEIISFNFIDEKDYYAGRNLILVQLRLDDTIFIQKRSYTKMSDIFSKVGGYMELMNTIFILISSFINRLNSELKIINSIFNFNTKENTMILKLKTLNEFGTISKSNKNTLFSSKKSFNSIRKLNSQNKSKNNLIIKNSNNLYNNNISVINISDNNNKISDNNQKNEQNFTIYNKKKIVFFENLKNNSIRNSKNERGESDESIHVNKDFFKRNLFNMDKDSQKNTKNRINISLIDYLCKCKKSKKNKYIQLYIKGNSFYKKKMDIVHTFNLLQILEDYVTK